MPKGLQRWFSFAKQWFSHLVIIPSFFRLLQNKDARGGNLAERRLKQVQDKGERQPAAFKL